MSIFNQLLGKTVRLTISGNKGSKGITGMLIDYGSDIVVLFNGERYIYLPKIHIQSINHFNDFEIEIKKPDSIPIAPDEETLSLRKVLMNAKGLFSEIFITSNLSIHGYITNVLNDYFIFYSPVYKMMLIPLHHLKWLTPYDDNERPYDLSNEELPLLPYHIPMARSFTEQCKKYEGKLVIFDLGIDSNRIGKLVKIVNNQIQLTVGRNETVFINVQHIKTVHLP
ncbi:DUF2642 domain-containing protein [Fictibacillus barbaricus]|uniref:RNase P/RNase MRP subunit p29 n=1 Tax=Fictibacillus barbaricus TaxID=182136 RepID=A0ABU1U0G2_9BACL|nr:DUF2642 domain-containing protein [Fictibacillus barbaricus]MDR7072960.1 RNase P/RNase MRP subunit p29 [Fictibacillus barbaricus]